MNYIIARYSPATAPPVRSPAHCPVVASHASLTVSFVPARLLRGTQRTALTGTSTAATAVIAGCAHASALATDIVYAHVSSSTTEVMTPTVFTAPICATARACGFAALCGEVGHQ